MIKIIKNVEVYAPDHLGKKDVLIADKSVAAIKDSIEKPANLPGMEVIEGDGQLLVPGFIDPHVHISGGGGEGSFTTRTASIRLSQATTAGVTTLIGVRGTDGFCRHMEELVAKAKSLKEEGVTCYVLTGSYQVPVRSITGDIEKDLMLIEEVIGVGEIALSDHRSSQPTFDEIAKIAASARVGGILSGKSGVVNIHVGDGPRKVDLIHNIVAKTELPYRQFCLTHMNRNPDLFREGIDFAKRGGHIDYTTSTPDPILDEGTVKCSKALKACLDAGVAENHITFSSDGQGSLPIFNTNKEMIGLGIGSCESLFLEVRSAVQDEGIPLETALKVITSNPADLYRLEKKGRLSKGKDADLVFLNANDLSIRSVMAMGKQMVKDGEIVVYGTFEQFS
jgi:beta-aspartyl-dipeptidase (metallo-type)